MSLSITFSNSYGCSFEFACGSSLAEVNPVGFVRIVLVICSFFLIQSLDCKFVEVN